MHIRKANLRMHGFVLLFFFLWGGTPGVGEEKREREKTERRERHGDCDCKSTPRLFSLLQLIQECTFRQFIFLLKRKTVKVKS